MKYVLARLLAAVLLLIITLSMPTAAKRPFYVFDSATWSETPDGQERPISPGGGLMHQNGDLKECCIGTYHYVAEIAAVQAAVGSLKGPVSLYFPALGGDVELEINGEVIPLPQEDFSSVGPIVPLKPEWLTRGDLRMSLTLLGPGFGFVGPWKSPPMIGGHFELEQYRTHERRFQVEIPYLTSLPMLFLGVVFAFLHFATGRQFEFYRLFAFGLVLIAVFELYLAGLPRSINFYLGSLTHYSARIVAAVGTLFLIDSYLSWTNNQARFPRRVRNRIVIFQLALAVVTAVAAAQRHGTVDAVACAIAMPLAFAPIFAWRLDRTQVKSLHFVIYAIVLTAAIASVADATKLILWRFAIPVPYQYFDRHILPLLVSQTVIIYFAHFIVFFNRCREQATIIAGQRTLNSAFQMIAHDVRAPFSRLRLGLRLLDAKAPGDDLRETIVRVRSEVDRSLQSVDGILSDVLELGRTARPETESHDPAALFEEALQDVTAMHSRSPQVERRLSHTSAVRVDPTRLKRVLINLIENAFHATPPDGKIWLATRDVREAGSPFVELVLGNSGSVIPKDRLETVFEAFQTFGKKGGTGLGLAIARKITEAHGGRIFCRSSEETGTEFIFTVPADATPRKA